MEGGIDGLYEHGFRRHMVRNECRRPLHAFGATSVDG
jgi:hypothetical protein